MDAAPKLVELDSGMFDAGTEFVQRPGCPTGAPGGNGGDEHLRPVESIIDLFAQLVTDLASLLVGRLDQPSAGRGELFDALAGIGLKAAVGDGESRRRGHRVDQGGVVEHSDVMHQYRYRTAVIVDRRHDVVRRNGVDIDALSGVVDISPLVRRPVADDE